MDERELKQAVGIDFCVVPETRHLVHDLSEEREDQRNHNVYTSHPKRKSFLCEVLQDTPSYILLLVSCLRTPLLFILLFLTNPLWAQQRWILVPDPSSLTAINSDPKKCHDFEGGGVGCTEADLTFSRMMIRKSYYTSSVDVVFRPNGAWAITIRYYPQMCKPERGVWLCKNVSWRAAK